MAVTWTGRDLVTGERDRTITFRELGFDWAAAGYTIWLELVAPDTTCTVLQLDAVSGETDQAYLGDTAGLFDQTGNYRMKLLARKDGFDRNLASINYYRMAMP